MERDTVFQMDSLLDTAPCGFLSLDDNGAILFVNRTLGEWLGYEPSELVGRSIETILSIGGRIFYQTHISPLLKLQNRAEEIYFSLKCKNGQALPVLTQAVRGEREGEFVSDCVFLPMRQRREYEDELLQAKKVAEEATQAKARFLSMMSHELRTPMNAILGFGQLLQMDELDALQSESVEHILRAGQHLLELINEVLDLSRVEAEGLDVALEPVSAGQVMREAFEMARPLADKAGIELRMQPGSDQERWVRSDARRLRQILLNLLANAIKYNRQGGNVTLCCEGGAHGLEERNGPDEGLRFVVSDSGAGIAPDKLDKLFVPFERLGAEGGEIEGTGLGLALCKRLTEAMDGHIGVNSIAGQGSSFWVEFPGAPDPSVAAPALVEDATGGVGTPTMTSLLLYVEDNAPNLQLVQRILSKRPAVRLLPVTTGEAGLQLARAHLPDLILLDLQLPDMNGDLVLEGLRRDKRTCDIPVVILSSDATPRQIERLLKTGARDYLTKPLDVPKFLSVLDALLEKSPKRLASVDTLAA